MAIQVRIDAKTKSVKDIKFRNELQENMFKFLLAVSKEVNAKDVDTYGLQMSVFCGENDKTKIIVAFRAGITRWLTTVFLHFSDEELKGLRLMAAKFKERKDTHGYLFEVLKVIPKPKPIEVKKPSERKMEEPKEAISFDFLDSVE